MSPASNHRPVLDAAAVAGALALLALAAGLRPGLGPAKVYQPAFALDDASREAVNSTPFAQILGEARASAADLMWIKTERYLHRGVAYAAHLDEEEMARSGSVTRKDEKGAAAAAAPQMEALPASLGEQTHEAMADMGKHEAAGGHEDAEHHHGMTSLIPDATNDFRGYVGILHREIQPWLPPGSEDKHSGGDELLPWYRLLTYSNPHHWRGYMIGTWWLMQQRNHDKNALGEARQFIDEGVKNNPEVFQLNLMRARLLFSENDFTGALKDTHDAVNKGLMKRTKDGKAHPPQWTDDDEEDFRNALRYAPFIYVTKLHDLTRGKEELARARALAPADIPLQEFKLTN